MNAIKQFKVGNKVNHTVYNIIGPTQSYIGTIISEFDEAGWHWYWIKFESGRSYACTADEIMLVKA